MALALAGMGLVWVLRRHWRFGAAVIAVAFSWVILFGVLMVPHVAGGSTFGGVYDLGSTPSEILVNSAKDPSRLVEKLDENNAPGYAGSLAQPYGFVPLLSPVTLLIGLPQWSINIVSASAWTFDLRFHYQAIPSAALAISLVGGLAWLRRWRWRSLEPLVAIALTVALAFALLATRWYGPSPSATTTNWGSATAPAAQLPVACHRARLRAVRRRGRQRLQWGSPPHAPRDRVHVPEPVASAELRRDP